jgi:UDP-glucose 4-epimerase
MVLITGGAGYIGSHVVKQLLEQNEDIIVLDNLSTGNQKTLDTLSEIREFKFIKGDLKNLNEIEKIFIENNINTIMHFAASIVVSESVKNPIKYYTNNTVNTTNLVSCAIRYNVKKFIFSSTAAVYGEPKNITSLNIDENYPTNPINPYGKSKLFSENIIKDVSVTNETFKYIIFRYFNVAGADMYRVDEKIAPRIGQSFPSATHLIKVASECATLKRKNMNIFGDTYPTEDGTCIRDYIHVDDVAMAHIQAMKYLDNNKSEIFNLGYGKGYSVKKVINTIQTVSKVFFEVIHTENRKGDPSILVANNNKILKKMKWVPKYNDLELICDSAYAWEKVLNNEKK